MELVPKTQGVVSAIKQTKFAISLARRGKVPPPFPPHVAENVGEARALRDLVRTQGRAIDPQGHVSKMWARFSASDDALPKGRSISGEVDPARRKTRQKQLEN